MPVEPTSVEPMPVEPMPAELPVTVVSQPIPGGHLMLVHAPPGACVQVRFADDDSLRDVTVFAADLALVGLVNGTHGSGTHDALVANGQGPDPADEVCVADVQVVGDVTAFYVHPASTAAVAVAVDELAQLVATGAAQAITAGVSLTEDPAPDTDTRGIDEIDLNDGDTNAGDTTTTD